MDITTSSEGLDGNARHSTVGLRATPEVTLSWDLNEHTESSDLLGVVQRERH